MNEQLFSAALGLQEPIYIEEIRFTEDELHIHLNFYKSSEFPCPHCGKLHKVYDTREKIWRHLNFFQYKCFLHFPTPRTDFPQCGKHQYLPPSDFAGPFLWTLPSIGRLRINFRSK
jgi:transposase